MIHQQLIQMKPQNNAGGQWFGYWPGFDVSALHTHAPDARCPLPWVTAFSFKTAKTVILHCNISRK